MLGLGQKVLEVLKSVLEPESEWELETALVRVLATRKCKVEGKSLVVAKEKVGRILKMVWDLVAQL